MSKKLCKTDTLLLCTTNRKYYMAYRFVPFSWRSFACCRTYQVQFDEHLCDILLLSCHFLSAIAELLVKMAAVHHVGFSFLTAWAVKGPILHHCAKFCKDRLNSCCNIAIFWFSNMTAAAILNFQKFHVLMIDLLYGASMCHCAKFCPNRSNGCGDIAI